MTADNIIDVHFPYKELTPILGDPSYADLHDRHQKLKTNAANVPTQLTAGNLGLLPLIISPTDYAAQANGQAWIHPANPGAPPIIAQGTSAVNMKNDIATYQNNVTQYQRVVNTAAALKKLIVNMVHENYLMGIRDDDTGFAGVSPWEMMDYLYTNHGQLLYEDLVKNKNRLNEPFDPTEPIFTLFNRYTDICTVAAKGNQPINETDKISSAYLCLKESGAYAKTIDDWDDKASADKTWTNFKTLFITAYHKLKRQGGNQANMMQEQIPANIADTLHEIASKFDAEQQEMANFIQANTNLKDMVESCKREIAALKITVDTLSKKVNTQKSGRTSSGNKSQTDNRNPAQRAPQMPKMYCHSCGLTNDPLNCSMNCPNPKPGHKRWATYERKFGGSTANCPDT
jgi:conjugal transfer/entry exclusion protein